MEASDSTSAPDPAPDPAPAPDGDAVGGDHVEGDKNVTQPPDPVTPGESLANPTGDGPLGGEDNDPDGDANDPAAEPESEPTTD